MKDLSLRAQTSLAVANGATTPAPASGERPIIWSTTESAFLHWNGTNWLITNDVYVPSYTSVLAQLQGDYTNTISPIGVIATVSSGSVSSLNLSSIYFDDIYLQITNRGPGVLLYIGDWDNSWNSAATGVYEITSIISRSNIVVKRAKGWELGKLVAGDSIIFSEFAAAPPYTGNSDFALSGVSQTLFTDSVDVSGNILTLEGYYTHNNSLIFFYNLNFGGTLPSPISLNTLYYLQNSINVIGTYSSRPSAITGITTITTVNLSSVSFSGAILDITTIGTEDNSEIGICSFKVVQLPGSGGQYSTIKLGSSIVGSYASSYLEENRVVEINGTNGGIVSLGKNILNESSVAIGENIVTFGERNVVAGYSSMASNGSVAINGHATSPGSLAINGGFVADSYATGGTAISGGRVFSTGGIAVGSGAYSVNTGEYSRGRNPGFPLGDRSSEGITDSYISSIPLYAGSTTPSVEYLIFERIFEETINGISIEVLPSRIKAYEAILANFDIPGYGVEYEIQGSISVSSDLPSASVIYKYLHQKIIGAFGTTSEADFKIRLEVTSIASTRGPYISQYVKPMVRLYGIGASYWQGDINIRFTNNYDYSPSTIPHITTLATVGGIDVIASETLTAGQAVNLFNSAGVAKIRKADKSNGRRADGYILQNYVASDTAYMYINGENPYCSGLTVGDVYLSTTGGYSSTPATTGQLSQRVGFALSSTKLLVQLGEPIQR